MALRPPFFSMILSPHHFRRLLLGTVLPLLAVLASRASTTPDEPPPTPSALTRMRDDLLHMNEFFDTTLPGTLKRYNLVMDFTPKFSDVRDKEFIRYPLELRYGLREKWELFGGLTPFSPNPFNGGRDQRWGPGQAQLGVRHDVGAFFGLYDHVTVGIETRAPLGQPPFDLIDQFSHLRPFVAAARDLPLPHTTFLTSYSYDRAVDTPGRGTVPPEAIRQHVAEVAPGLLYKPGEFGGFAEFRYRYFQQDRSHHFGRDYKAGLIWDVPLARSLAWHLPGKWQGEFGYKISDEQGVSRSHGFIASVRWRTTLREMLSYNPAGLLRTK
jgi:hypothetical protein